MPAAPHNDSHPSDSKPQREIEKIMIRRLGEQHSDWEARKWKDVARQLGLPETWLKAEPDVVWNTPEAILVGECYARTGKLSAGHRRKLAMDALKLIALRQLRSAAHGLRCALVVTEETNAQLCGGWFADAIHLVEIIPIGLSKEEKLILEAATDRQASGQARQRRFQK